MRTIIHNCPICGETLAVTKLHCQNCETTIEGQFALEGQSSLGRFHHLSPEQLQFAETFLRCEGKINRVEEELKISYPTVRARLNDLIRAMGYEVKEEEAPAAKTFDRKAILAELANGAITAEEAARRLAGKVL
jgi:hypothetical protein